jgi:hypothetical protein
MKFAVIKNDDAEKYLNTKGQESLNGILETIADSRSMDGKKNNEYLVINTDEPYADEVIEILKRNGHWG